MAPDFMVDMESIALKTESILEIASIILVS